MIEKALQTGDPVLLQQAYLLVTGKVLDTKCGECLSDARIVLQAHLREQQRKDSKIILFINVYEDKNEKRNEELQECLWQNKNNPHIEVVEVTGRPTYSDLFAMFTDEVNIICNSDIFFDETIQFVKQIKDIQVYALTRWDWNGNGKAKFLNRYDSQDAWVFRGKLKKNIFSDFYLGIAGCDNRIAYELKRAGYQVLNPSLSVRAFHYHLSEVRYYNPDNAVEKPYHFVTPTSLIL